MLLGMLWKQEHCCLKTQQPHRWGKKQKWLIQHFFQFFLLLVVQLSGLNLVMDCGFLQQIKGQLMFHYKWVVEHNKWCLLDVWKKKKNHFTAPFSVSCCLHFHQSFLVGMQMHKKVQHSCHISASFKALTHSCTICAGNWDFFCASTG